MNNSIFTFKLNHNIKITIEIDQYPDDYPYCLYEDNFFLYYNNNKIKLLYDSIASFIEQFIIILQQAIHHEKQIPIKNCIDIGYAWNLYLNVRNHQQLNYAKKEYEALEDFNLWYSTYTTWIYNDTNNNIIIEITPTYPNTYDESQSYQDFLQWMQNYKPLLKTIIPKNTAEQWLMQAQQILDTIDENTQMLHEQGKL
ncbi:MAG: hypothetical protein ACXWL2_04970 [Candidatus Chromulinivorax sp.]